MRCSMSLQRRQFARAGLEFEQAENDIVHALGGENQRHFVDGLDVAAR